MRVTAGTGSDDATAVAQALKHWKSAERAATGAERRAVAAERDALLAEKTAEAAFQTLAAALRPSERKP